MRALDPRLLRRARAARILLGVDIAAGVASAVLLLVQASLIALVVTQAFYGRRTIPWPLLAVLVLVFATRGALAWTMESAGRRAASVVLSELRLALAERRLRRQPAALDGVEAAEVATAAVQGIDALEAYFARYLPQVVLACVVPVAVLVWVARVDIISALVMLLTLPLVPVFMALAGRLAVERSRESWDALRRLSLHFLDAVRGLPTLVAFNRARPQEATLAAAGERYRTTTIAALRVGFLSSLTLELAATIGVALVAVTVGVRLVSGSVGLQAALTALILAPELYAPLRRLGAEYHASADGIAVADRIFDLLDEPAVPVIRGTRTPVSPARASVQFEAVCFRYPARDALVLDRLDLELAPCETVALVGESGAGKSTVAALLLKLAGPTSGRISVAGIDLATCDSAAWREFVSWLPQRPLIVHGSVADNIRLGAPHAARARMLAAARLAGADDVAARLPDGYETRIGDGGRPLSAGERQRIGLARALLRDTPLVILDEPTANLDSESAAVVLAALDALRGRRTVLLLAHRADVAAHADRVLELSVGRAVTVGCERAA